MNMNFIENINDNDTLDQIINAAQNRKNVLNVQEQEKDWQNFKNALYNYLDKWESIDIQDSYDVLVTLEKEDMYITHRGIITVRDN